MAFPWEAECAGVPFPHACAYNDDTSVVQKIGHMTPSEGSRSGAHQTCHGIPSRPAEAFADFSLRERKHFAGPDVGTADASLTNTDEVCVRAKGSSLRTGLDPVDDGTQNIFGNKVMHISRTKTSSDDNNGGVNLLGQPMSATLTSTALCEGDADAFGVKKWKRNKKKVDPAYGQHTSATGTHASAPYHHSGGWTAHEQNNESEAGTFRSASHIPGYTGFISRASPSKTSVPASGRENTWNKDLLVANHKTKISGYSGHIK